MRKLNVILNDYPNEAKTIIAFNNDDFEGVDSVWEKPDEPNLVKIQKMDRFKGSFAGFTRFADLTPNHFRMLIQSMYVIVAALPEEERQNSTRAEVGMFSFLILAYIRCLEHATDSTIETFKVNVISPLNISYEFLAEVEIAFEPPAPADEGEFSIVMVNDDD
jgi:hypothetical protein